MLPNTSDPQTDYGLPYDDYDPNEVVDPRTEQSAAFAEASLVDLAGLTMVSPRAYVHVSNDGTPAIEAHAAVWGSSDTVKPTISKTGDGVVVLTWALSGGYPDLNPTPARQVYRTPAFKWAQVTAYGTQAYFATAIVTSNTVTVYTFDASGVAADNDFYLIVG